MLWTATLQKEEKKMYLTLQGRTSSIHSAATFKPRISCFTIVRLGKSFRPVSFPLLSALLEDMNRRPEQKAEHGSIAGTNKLSLGSGSPKKSGVWKTTKVYLKAGQEGRCVLQDGFFPHCTWSEWKWVVKVLMACFSVMWSITWSAPQHHIQQYASLHIFIIKMWLWIGSWQRAVI